MKLLLVDSDEHTAPFLHKGLHVEGYEVDTISTGRVALESASAGGYAGIILELLLPDMDGREVCLRLREGGCELPILILTAQAAENHKLDAFRAGADDCMTKPFAFIELVMRIKALIRRSPPSRELPLLRHGDLVLDCSTFRVTQRDRLIELTPREFTLLRCLMENRSEVLSAARILDHAWGIKEDPLTNIVSVYITRLRRKLQPAGHEPLIMTLRGVGYRFG